MPSKCAACWFPDNDEGANACQACGTELLATTTDDEADVRVVEIELPPKEALGMQLMAPANGVIDHGLGIVGIDNPLLENIVMVGDVIVAIGGHSVDQMGYSNTIDLIRQLPRPLAITIEIREDRRQQALTEKKSEEDLEKQLSVYTVVFDDGPMGLNLEEAVRYGIDGAVVRALKGQARTCGMISIGDILYKVNETEVLRMPYAEVVNLLRNAVTPKTLQFVPKSELVDVQRMNSRSFRHSSSAEQQLIKNPHIVKDNGSNDEDKQSIAQLIMENQAATIMKGRMFKQGWLMRNWESRYFVLSVAKIEYFKSPSSAASSGEMSFLGHRSTVRSLPGRQDIVYKAPNVLAEYLLELRVDDRRLVLACTSEQDKERWMDAIKLAINASKTVNRTQNLSESLREAKVLRAQYSGSISVDGSFMNRDGNGRLSQFNYESFSTPVVHVAVLSAVNLTRSGSSVNGMCEVTVGAETFKTSAVKGQRSPVWKQDNVGSFEVPSEGMVIKIRVFNEHVFRSSELLATLTIPLKSLPNMRKSVKKYALALGSRSAGAVLTLSLEYVNKAKAYQDDQVSRHFERMTEREEMIKLQSEAQLAADEASYRAASAEEEARQLLEQARKKAEAAMAAAREEQEQGRAAVEAAMAEAAQLKEEAELQVAEARRAQEEAKKLIEANRRIQDQPMINKGTSNDGRLGDQQNHAKIMNERDGVKKETQMTVDDAAASLDQVKFLCTTMDEAQAMCEHIHARLICLAKKSSSPRFVENETIQTEYADVVDRFRAFLAQYGNKRVIARIVSGRVIVSVCHEIHEAMSALAKFCEVDIGQDHLEWKARFESDSETQRGLLRLAQEQDHLLLNELGDTSAQEEALTLLLFEIDHRAGEYEPQELQLINRIFQSVASYSRLGVPSVPSWFVPPHEVELAARIARGAFGTVYRGSWIGTDVAVKSVLFLEDSKTRQAFVNEADIWSSLQHPHIVKLFGACHVGNPFFVCEYASSGNLSEYLFRSENRHKTWKCLHEAARGLWYLHAKQKIVHRDIKSNNIVIGQDGVAKLTDFGLSCRVADLPSAGNASEVGAIRWKAPECISGESSGSFAADVYSFGMTIIEAVTGRLPFGTMPDVAVRFKVVKFHQLPQQPTEMTDSQWDLIMRMCATNPDDRIDLSTAVDALKPFADEEYYGHLQKEWDLTQSTTPDRS